MITRRTLLVALGAGPLAAPLAALAQQTSKVWRIGFLSANPRSTSYELGFTPFLQRMRDLGYVEGKNLHVEARFADTRTERLPELAGELVRDKVDVMLAWATPAVMAARQASSTTPIVMVGVADPIGSGFVVTLARPGGNVTGVTNIARDLSGKLLELLVQVVPGIKRVAVMRNPANPSLALQLTETEAAARKLDVKLQLVDVRAPEEFADAFTTMTRDGAAGFIVLPEPIFLAERRRIAELATKHLLPGVFGRRENTDAGGLISYGPSLADQFRQAATYVDRILHGAKPADLPVEQPTRFELVINLKTAMALGITIPQSLLLRANEVIQ